MNEFIQPLKGKTIKLSTGDIVDIPKHSILEYEAYCSLSAAAKIELFNISYSEMKAYITDYEKYMKFKVACILNKNLVSKIDNSPIDKNFEYEFLGGYTINRLSKALKTKKSFETFFLEQVIAELIRENSDFKELEEGGES